MLNCTRPKRDGWEKFNLSPQASRARRSGQSETWDLPAGRLLKPDLFAKCHRQPGLLSFHETKEVQVTSVAYLHSIPGRQTIRLNKTTTVASPKKKASQKSHFRSENHLPVLQSLGSHVSFRVKIVTHTVWFSNFSSFFAHLVGPKCTDSMVMMKMWFSKKNLQVSKLGKPRRIYQTKVSTNRNSP